MTDKSESKPTTYAELSWRPSDVQDLFDCTVEEAESFLSENEKHIRDHLCKLGFEVIGTLGDMDGLKRRGDDEEDNDDEEDEENEGN